MKRFVPHLPPLAPPFRRIKNGRIDRHGVERTHDSWGGRFFQVRLGVRGGGCGSVSVTAADTPCSVFEAALGKLRVDVPLPDLEGVPDDARAGLRKVQTLVLLQVAFAHVEAADKDVARILDYAKSLIVVDTDTGAVLDEEFERFKAGVETFLDDTSNAALTSDLGSAGAASSLPEDGDSGGAASLSSISTKETRSLVTVKDLTQKLARCKDGECRGGTHF